MEPQLQQESQPGNFIVIIEGSEQSLGPEHQPLNNENFI